MSAARRPLLDDLIDQLEPLPRDLVDLEMLVSRAIGNVFLYRNGKGDVYVYGDGSRS